MKKTVLEIEVRYFAGMRERAGRDSEVVETAAGTPAELYAELRARHGFALEQAHLRVAVNDAFAKWETPLSPGDSVVYIPPVAGG